MAPLPKDCTGCGCLAVEADWKALNNGTNNCTAVPITCKNASGAITAICVK
ncbi:MAG: hypothetical protein U0169_18780 [Polyangiaceae bacterium]